MVFASLLFLMVFLPAAVGTYYACPRNDRSLRNLVLLAFSVMFFWWGGAPYLVIFALSALVDFLCGILIEKRSDRARLWLATSLALNVSLLVYFKYANFFIGELNRLRGTFAATPVEWVMDVMLPIGISFFTFHKITYVVDVFRGTKPALRRFDDFALYLTFFPQLIAGPIVRFHEISGQLRGRQESLDAFFRGVLRFSLGLTKKVVVADPCGEVADAVFNADPGVLNAGTAWIGAVAYAVQLYFDFSGYTDMALGLGLMFGFRLPENFNRPYRSVSITDFWRRWHMSLSRFFRDYVYIPLGGNRGSSIRTYANLILVFALCGLWHGANWTFLIWGLYHGFWLVLERATSFGRGEAAKDTAVRRFATFGLVVIGWVIFRANDLDHAGRFFTAMVTFGERPYSLAIETALNHRNLFVLSAAGAWELLAPTRYSITGLSTARLPAAGTLMRVAVAAGFVLYAVASLATNSYTPFLYFRF